MNTNDASLSTRSLAIVCGLALCGLLAAAAPASADITCEWTGAGVTAKWSDGGNWALCHGGGVVPQNGDTVIFRPGRPRASNQNDIPNLTLDKVDIEGLSGDDGGTRWETTGFGVTITSFVAAASAVDSRGLGPAFRAPIALGSLNTTIFNSTGGPTSALFTLGDINLNGFSLLLQDSFPVSLGAMSGNGTVRKFGAGPLTLSESTFTGQFQCSQGTLLVATPHALGASGPSNETQVLTACVLVLEANVSVDESLIVTNTKGVGGGIPGLDVTAVRVLAGVNATLTGAIGLPTSTIEVDVPTTSQLTLAGPITGAANMFLAKTSGGTLVVSNPASAYSGLVSFDGPIRLGAPGGIPDTTIVALRSPTASLDLNNISETIGPLTSVSNSGRVLLGSGTLTINVTGNDAFVYFGSIAGTGGVAKIGTGIEIWGGPAVNTYTGATTVEAGTLAFTKPSGTRAVVGPIVVNGGVLDSRDGNITPTAPATVGVRGRMTTQNEAVGSLAGAGLVDGGLTIGANNASTTFSGTMQADNWTKVGGGTLVLTGTDIVNGRTEVLGGTLVVGGSLGVAGTVGLDDATLGGAGRVGRIFHTEGRTKRAAISPGPGSGPGILDAESASLDNTTLVIELNGPDAGTGYDRLDLEGGDLALAATSMLQVSRRFGPHAGAKFTIVSVPAGHAVTGTFAGLAEGATLTIGGQRYAITYHGGDGNDVALTALEEAPAPPAITYFLSEGATGEFFDEDVLIANPTDTAAPVTLTFSKENGEQVVATNTVPAQAHLTVHVDKIPGLQATTASAQVRSDAGTPLLVERSMFWDKSYYAGHTGSAVEQAAPDWFFAEGSQGFFETFVLVINPNTVPADVTFTFFRENEPPVVKTLQVGAATRLTLRAGDIPELVTRSFGIAVHATQPIMAERSMYFGTTASRLWSGGTESAGVTAASTHWFLAEGATGAFFDTFVLLSNPQGTDAHVDLQYLLDTGDTVSAAKTITANARLTINIKGEDDPRLRNAAVSTIVTSDVPILAERSMYWPGAAKPWGEGHNSFGVVDAGTSWGLAEGRVGGPLRFHTYILLANPGTTAADVTVRYLRDTGAPIVKTYTVPATSRFNIDTSSVTELRDESFGAVVSVTNNLPIIVERSMYWDSNGFSFSGGTNATGIRLSQPQSAAGQAP